MRIYLHLTAILAFHTSCSRTLLIGKRFTICASSIARCRLAFWQLLHKRRYNIDSSRYYSASSAPYRSPSTACTRPFTLLLLLLAAPDVWLLLGWLLKWQRCLFLDLDGRMIHMFVLKRLEQSIGLLFLLDRLLALRDFEIIGSLAEFGVD